MKNLMNLGIVLTILEQKNVNGGKMVLACVQDYCGSDDECPGSCGCYIEEGVPSNYCN